jgi:hypothetical protein
VRRRRPVLLADAANEGGQGAVGAARSFERGVGRGVADVGDVDRAFALELRAGIGRHGDWHVLQHFSAASGRDHNITGKLRLLILSLGFGGSLGGRLLLILGECCLRKCGNGGGAGQKQGARSGYSPERHQFPPHFAARWVVPISSLESIHNES